VWPFLSSVAVNNIMPFRAGDALRILGFRRQLLSPPMRVLGTLVVERLLDLVALLGFFFGGLIGLTAGAFPEKLVVIGAWLAGASLAGLFAIILLAPRLPRLIQSIADRPSFSERGLSEMVQRFGANFAEALSLVRSPARLFALFSLSLVAWVFEGAVFATVAFAFDSGATPLAPWFSLATATLATLLPSSPGYVGTFDYFAVLGMTSYGYPREAALAFALVVHALLWLPLTVLGIAYLLIRGDSIWRRSAAVSAASED
jgi:hypothetical protein